MARPSNTEERRRQIVDGMATIIARNGYDGASIAEIAEAAGLTAGLVHYHFGSKQEILVELVHLLARELRERLIRRLAEASSPTDRLRSFIDVHLAVGPDADPRIVSCWVHIAAEAIRQDPVRLAYREAVQSELEQLEGLVRTCLSDRGAGTRPARAIAAGVFAAIEGYFVLTAADPSLVPAGSAARTVRMMAEGLVAQAT